MSSVPKSESTFEEFTDHRLAAVEKYRLSVQRLRFGDLVGLSEAVTAELARRKPLLEREGERDRRADRSGIGNR